MMKVFLDTNIFLEYLEKTKIEILSPTEFVEKYL